MYRFTPFLNSLLFLIFSIPVSVSAQIFLADGVWYNKLKDRVIVIESGEKGLFIKYIHGAGRTTLFEPSGHNVFMDSHKNRIILKNARTLIYKSRNGLKKLTFKLIESHIKVPESNHAGLNTFSGQGETKSQYPKQAPVLPVEGTWEVLELNKKLFITETRDGLKARLSDEKEWHMYLRDKQDYIRFVSEKGSVYEWISASEMRWLSADGKRSLKLVKLSDDF